MKRSITSLVMMALLAISLVSLFVACEKKDDQIVIGANIYTFADNFMNGVMKPELESYAAGKGVRI